jgi:transcriptional regulator with XRE-family HTH domain
MKSRIERILEAEQLTASRFADIIQVQRSNVSHILAERNKPGLDFLQKVLQAFPSINGDWLLTGRGSMYIEENEPKSNVADQNLPGLLQFKEEDPAVYHTTSSRKSENTLIESVKQAPVVEPKGNASRKVMKILVVYDDYSIETFNSQS